MEKKKTSTAMDNGLYITGWCIIGTLLLLVLFIKATNIQLSKYLFPCVLHSLTGLYCPGCGGTRAVAFLLHGDFLHSLVYHPFVPYAFVLCTWFMISQTIERLSKGRLRIGMHFREAFLWIALAIIIASKMCAAIDFGQLAGIEAADGFIQALQNIFNMLLLTASVKGVDEFMRRTFAL